MAGLILLQSECLAGILFLRRSLVELNQPKCDRYSVIYENSDRFFKIDLEIKQEE